MGSLRFGKEFLRDSLKDLLEDFLKDLLKDFLKDLLEGSLKGKPGRRAVTARSPRSAQAPSKGFLNDPIKDFLCESMKKPPAGRQILRYFGGIPRNP